MITLVLTELQKLRGSLALLVAVAAPALPGLLVMLALLANDRAASWTDTYRFALSLWALFLAPMVIAAFTVLTAQIEHRGHGWDHLLALPIARWRIFVAKIVVTFAAVVIMTVLVLGFVSLGTFLGGAMGPGVPEEAFPWAKLMEQRSHDRLYDHAGRHPALGGLALRQFRRASGRRHWRHPGRAGRDDHPDAAS